MIKSNKKQILICYQNEIISLNDFKNHFKIEAIEKQLKSIEKKVDLMKDDVEFIRRKFPII